MNTLLLVLGVLGIGAIAIAAYVFTVAARNYVSDSSSSAESRGDQEGETRLYVVRSNQDRRQYTGNINFPLRLPTGELIESDRRGFSDRRIAS